MDTEQIGDFLSVAEKNCSLTISIIREEKSPSFFTIRTVIQGLDFSFVSEAFRNWTSQYVLLAMEWISADGKATAGTMSGLR